MRICRCFAIGAESRPGAAQERRGRCAKIAQVEAPFVYMLRCADGTLYTG